MGLQGTNLAGTSTTRDRVDNDYYATDPLSTVALLKAHKFYGSNFLEPCCGEGHISKIVSEYYPNVEIDSIDCISFRPENRYQSLVVNTVTLDTEIKISAKITKKVSELVEMERTRLNELMEAIDKELDLQNSI